MTYADEPMTPERAHRIDAVIEDARRDEVLAEQRTELRDELTRLTPEGRDVLRTVIRFARWIDASIRADEGFDEHEGPLDLIDEATAYASGEQDEPSEPTSGGLTPHIRHDLGTDFRGLTATAGQVRQALGAVNEDAPVWVIARGSEGQPEQMYAVDAVTVAEDGTTYLLGPGAHL